MKIVADARIPFPRTLVFSTYRDRLPKLVPFLPDIKAIEVQSREDSGDVSRILNLWSAKSEIPKIVQSILKPEMLAWEDHAVWNQAEWNCEWKVVPKFFTDHVKCHGQNRFIEQGKDTVFEMRGELEIDLKGVPGVPRLLASTAAPLLEKFIVALLTPNLVATASGLEAFLKSESLTTA